MDKKSKQILKSVCAIILCIAFLWTGKKFIWNQEPAKNQMQAPQTPPIAEITSTTVSQTTLYSFTETTTTTSLSVSDVTTTVSDAVTSTSVLTSATSTTVSEASQTNAPEDSSVSDARNLPKTPDMTDAPEGYFDDALFIGDSRMMGLSLWGRFDGATYFASTGLDTYKIDKSKSEAKGTKGQNFKTVLAAKQYKKVYIMLGINELGYDRNRTKQNYMDLITRIKGACPDAIIYIHGNLHVSHKRADKDSIVNNVQINEYNSFLASLADNVTTYYLDVNPLFDDTDGYLKGSYTNDGVHPYSKHYAAWKEYLATHAVVR